MLTNGSCTQISALVRRIIAPNPSPYTYTGTCTYIVGHEDVAIIDPGPASEGHIETLLSAIKGEKLRHILVTHTHKDHSSAAQMLQEKTGAKILGCTPHRFFRDLACDEVNHLEASADLAFSPDCVLKTSDDIMGNGWKLTALETPGHTMNHVCYALDQEKILFSGDHVMGWSTPMIAPPDGQMRAYMNSLNILRNRDDALFLPGHGDAITEPRRFVRAMIHHRKHREAAILMRIQAGDTCIAQIVASVYEKLAPALIGAARLTTLAHVESLVHDQLVTCDGALTLNSVLSAV